MNDFMAMWSSVGAGSKVALTIAGIGGTSFVGSWVILMRNALQNRANLDELLRLIELHAPQKMETFYSGDTIWRNRWRLNHEFYRFLKSDELDDVPAVQAAKQMYALSYQKRREILPVIGVFWLLILIGIGIMGYLIATNQVA